VPVFPDRSGISCDRIRQGADRQPRIGADDINLGFAGVLQKFREAGLAGEEHNVVSCGRCAARSQVHELAWLGSGSPPPAAMLDRIEAGVGGWPEIV